MNILQTKVYRECYPFSREVLYDSEKRKLITRLLRIRVLDLDDSKRQAMKSGRKIRSFACTAIYREVSKVKETRAYIENHEYANVDGIYLNWLLHRYKSVVKCFFNIGIFIPYQF